MGTRTRGYNTPAEVISGLKYGSTSAVNKTLSFAGVSFYGTMFIDNDFGYINLPDSLRGVGMLYRGVEMYDPDKLRDYIANNTALKNHLFAKYEAGQLATLQTFPDLTIRDKSDYMVDYVSKNFKARSQAGEIILSPMKRDTLTVESSFQVAVNPSGVTDFIVTTGGSPQYGNTQIYVQVKLPAFDAEVFGLTDTVLGLINAYSDVGTSANLQSAINSSYANAQQGELQLLTMIAESKSTVTHLAKTMNRVGSLLRAIKKGRFKDIAPKTFRKWRQATARGKAKLSSEIILDAWLEARYAWRPLIIDIQKTMKYLDGDHNTERKTFRATDRVQSSTFEVFTHSELGYTYEATLALSSSSSARAGVLTELKPSSSGHVRDLGLGNPVGTLWEVIPYSFVADWFLNISGVIHSLNPSPVYTYLGSWVTDQRNTTIAGTVKITSPSGAIKYVSISHIREYKDRIIDTEVSLFTIDVNLDTYKLIDAAALIQRWL